METLRQREGSEGRSVQRRRVPKPIVGSLIWSPCARERALRAVAFRDAGSQSQLWDHWYGDPAPERDECFTRNGGVPCAGALR